ncbi:MAG: hypothetical protein KDC87_09895 [Planctomycetes bacterium]|nr:hypothetical protein [Planctomycetota bacterium]
MIEGIVVAGYASLLLEIAFFAVPSEASARRLVCADTDGQSTDSEHALARARQRTTAGKLLCYGLPTAAGVLMFAIPLVAVFWPRILEPLLPLPLPPWCRPLGAGLLVIGRLMTAAASLQLRRAQRADAGLVPGGVFGVSRNPILVGGYVFYLGILCIFPCLVLLLGLPLHVWSMHRRVLMEESHLRSRFGPEYSAYVAAVPRYLVF